MLRRWKLEWQLSTPFQLSGRIGAETKSGQSANDPIADIRALAQSIALARGVCLRMDTRKSIYLSVAALAVFGLFWAALPIGWLEKSHVLWLWALVGWRASTLTRSMWGIWKQRASNPDRPNQNDN